jgi:hypothetical protein
MKITLRSRLHRAGRSLAAAGLALGLLAASSSAVAQDAPQQGGPGDGGGRRGQGGQFAGMQRVAGEVVSVSGANVTVKTEDDGTVTVVTTDNTRIMKGRGGPNGGGGNNGGGAPTPIKVADLKPGDGIMAMGNLDAPNKTLHAAMVAQLADAAQIKAMRENLGKTYITGRVTAIDLDNAKLTVERPDKVSQTIGLDDSTSFRRGGRAMRGGGMGISGATSSGSSAGSGTQMPATEGGESITLADIKVGDQVVGNGALKDGTFVPKELNVITPGQGGRRRNGQPGGANGAADGTAAPATPPSGPPSL